MRQNNFYVLIFLVIGLLGCAKEKDHPVPSYSFDQTINLSLPSYISLQGVGGWAYVSGMGVKGVIVYRKSTNHFIAFDRQSPADGGAECASGLVVDEENYLILNDPCSNSSFSLYDGSVISGDSKWGLRKYETDYAGGDLLRIYNL